ncbi:hypothetical protein [Fluviicola sp.]|uniref:hypothetical protein n=1 Tax=Fluviicola sp. TaxID=1917219 RepID=UPI003D27BAB8
MIEKTNIIDFLFNNFDEIRYVAIYVDNCLDSRQKEQFADNSSTETDQYEELLTNPTLLTTARQRGNIDCGGLRYLIVGYGNFYQLLKEVKGGHISICLHKDTDLNTTPDNIFNKLSQTFREFIE